MPDLNNIAMRDAEPVKVRHQTIGSSIYALWEQYLYGDGWRLVEIVMGTWVLLRGLSILFMGGMDANYYRAFPLSSEIALWGLLAVAIGAGRICGTIINGKWSRSPRLRWFAGVAAMAYQGMHFVIFAQLGLTLIAIGYLFWTVLEAAGVIRSTIDIRRKQSDYAAVGH
ncbi:hypothetical protein [Notoacmeibacter sp. MSK16QG-6]|uniref:hypothetical protein n=1 Tax=Notoacmeibacter sp. MSK16QG-6 TaxID=2957982 RepID=UPI0020A05D15|nr:hypothetical protein [Notoacmeibacter sp. MSK16QG-6]MCP1200042.1 hypothetical protein [Notoacmeibacter sp. MSK16QG-6]